VWCALAVKGSFS